METCDISDYNDNSRKATQLGVSKTRGRGSIFFFKKECCVRVRVRVDTTPNPNLTVTLNLTLTLIG